MRQDPPETGLGEQVRSDVRSWLSRSTGIRESLEAALEIPSFPSTLEQNAVLDLIDELVGEHPNVTCDRWVPDWEALSDFAAPTDGQRLFVPLLERDPTYREALPHIETTVYALRRGDGPVLMLNGHVDVVPADNQAWTSAPFSPRFVDGNIVARGAMDMKAGLIATAMAFRYLAETWTGSGTVLFAVVPEEESGGDGTLAALERGYTPDAAVFAEPTDLQVVHRHVGIQLFEVDVAGRPGGMLRRSWGLSAAPTLARAALALERLEAERTAVAKRAGGYDDDDLPGFVNFVMTAGDWLATRAARGQIQGLMGVLPGESQQQAEDVLRDAVLEATRSDDLPVDVRVRSGGHRGGELDATHPLVDSFTVDGVASGAPGSPTRAGTMVCDAKIVQGGGWAPSIVLGPIGGNLHSADEWVDLSSISTLVELLARGTHRWFSTAP